MRMKYKYILLYCFQLSNFQIVKTKVIVIIFVVFNRTLQLYTILCITSSTTSLNKFKNICFIIGLFWWTMTDFWCSEEIGIDVVSFEKHEKLYYAHVCLCTRVYRGGENLLPSIGLCKWNLIHDLHQLCWLSVVYLCVLRPLSLFPVTLSHAPALLRHVN